jgi:hypothetical protein
VLAINTERNPCWRTIRPVPDPHSSVPTMLSTFDPAQSWESRAILEREVEELEKLLLKPLRYPMP